MTNRFAVSLLPSRIQRSALAGWLIVSAWQPASAGQTPAPVTSAPAAAPVSARSAQNGTGPTLSLTMEQAVTMGLDANLSLRAEKLDLDAASLAIVSARAAFMPQVGTSLSRSSQRSI